MTFPQQKCWPMAVPLFEPRTASFQISATVSSIFCVCSNLRTASWSHAHVLSGPLGVIHLIWIHVIEGTTQAVLFLFVILTLAWPGGTCSGAMGQPGLLNSCNSEGHGIHSAGVPEPEAKTEAEEAGGLWCPGIWPPLPCLASYCGLQGAFPSFLPRILFLLPWGRLMSKATTA